ncbi:MAG: S8 family peptidase, partial [Bacteroidota bacterium]|nr:S8 family peptidase [Bacteroidota bacterium]
VYSSVVVAGHDYVTNGPRYTIRDTQGHGTAVAGIIAARRNNATGIAGIAGGDYDASLTQNGVQLVDLKLGNIIPTSVAISAIVEGATFSSAASGYGFGLHVMNHSWGAPLSSEALKDAMRTAYRNGCVFVASRGNGPPLYSPTDLLYPACYAENWVVSVGASGRDGQHKAPGNGNPNDNTDNTYESSYGGGVDLIAPGTNALVYTTRSQFSGSGSGQYIGFNGTSAAAPHVSGVAALVLSNQNDPNNPQNNLDGEDVQHLLKRTASDRVAPNSGAVPGYDNLTGWGLLNAGEAVLQSQPGIYKFAHANAISPANSAVLEQSNTAVLLPNSYSGNGASLKAGEYQADVWKITQVVAARYPSSPIKNSTFRVLDVWPRNSSSTLWGWEPGNPLVTEPGVRVTSWNQNSATVEGFTYHILTDEAGRTVDKWIPSSLSSNAKLDVTFYAYKWINSVEQPISQRSTAGFASTAYPNPASNEVSLTYENSPAGGELTVEILAGTGRSVKRQRFVAADAVGERSVQLPVAGLAAGFYTYRLITNQGVSVGKFIKQ